jgi:outer membrane immunogenic protein
MKRALQVAVVLTGAGLASAASAADLPTKAPRVYAPAAYDWTGFYVGANAGWGWTNGSGTITFTSGSGPVTGNGNGFVGGAQAGYNWQSGAIVLGLEADAQLTANSGSFNGSAGGVSFTSTAKVPWFSTVRARLGYAFDRWMVYGTGGGAFGQGKSDGTLSTTGAFSSTKNFETWTAGGGVEFALREDWTAKVEYLYIATPDHVPVPPGTSDISGNINTQIARVGLNYRF